MGNESSVFLKIGYFHAFVQDIYGHHLYVFYLPTLFYDLSQYKTETIIPVELDFNELKCCGNG